MSGFLQRGIRSLKNMRIYSFEVTDNLCAAKFDIFWLVANINKSPRAEHLLNFDGLPTVMMITQIPLVLWMFHTELIAYQLFAQMNLSLIGESVSLRCESFRIRVARGLLEEAVLCTSEEGCLGLWLPEEQTSFESCVCEEFPAANFTPVDKLPFLKSKPITTAPVRGKGGKARKM